MDAPVDLVANRTDEPIVTTMSAHSASAWSSFFGIRLASSGISSATSG